MRPAETLLHLLAAVNDEWADDPVDVRPRVTGMPGQTPSADWCSGDSCWTVYARLDTMVPATRFPLPDQAPVDFVAPRAVRWHLGTFMCVAGIVADGEDFELPSPEDQTADTVAVLDTAERLRCAVDRMISSRPYSRKTSLLGGWVPTGPAGGCAGGYWPLTVAVR